MLTGSLQSQSNLNTYSLDLNFYFTNDESSTVIYFHMKWFTIVFGSNIHIYQLYTIIRQWILYNFMNKLEDVHLVF
jgi:hypothetical protein